MDLKINIRKNNNCRFVEIESGNTTIYFTLYSCNEIAELTEILEQAIKELTEC